MQAAFGDFLSAGTATAAQIEFINMGVEQAIKLQTTIDIFKCSYSAMTSAGDEPAYYRDHLRCKQFDRLCDFRVWETADVDLAEKPIVSEELALIH